jgi:serine/threonine protein kinase
MAGIERTIAHYRILERLAAGGMGVVYRAEDLTLHRLVALKFLSPDMSADEEYRARFLREARVAAALNHQNTCTIYEVGEVEAGAHSRDAADPVASPGTPFIAMEFIEGETLAARLSRAGRLNAREVLDVALQVAEGLAEAHARQIVHRDLKPQNIMVTRDGRVKIVDFGLAKPLGSARSAGALVSTSEMISADLGDGAVIGTCAYMSPEQASRKTVDARSDIFAFGVMLYQMLAGRLPFRGDTATVILAKILETEPDPLPAPIGGKVPAALARIVAKCLRKGPQDRYADARDLVSELRDAQQPKAMRIGAWVRLRPASLAAIVIVCLTVVALTYWGVRRIAYGRQSVNDVPIDLSTLPADSTSSTPALAEASAERVRDSVSGDSQNLTSPEPTPAAPPESRPARSQDTGERLPAATASKTVTPPGEPLRPAPEAGTLVLDSSPQSSVTLDGTLVGITPLTIETGPGTHDLVMASPNGMRWRGRVDAVAGERTLVRRELSATGRLTIASDVWVEVSLDGGPPEQTPVDFAQVGAGLHQLRAFREGFVTQTLDIFIEEGRTNYVRVKLEKSQ